MDGSNYTFDSQIVYTPTTTGTYYLGAFALGNAYQGTFAIDAFALPTDPALPRVSEDTRSPHGETISNLFSDTRPLEIAVISNATSSDEGFWQYSIDSGNNWAAIAGNVSGSNALLLEPDAMLRFLPNLNWNGVPNDLWVELIPSSLGGNGSSADLTLLGGDQGLTLERVSTSVYAVNDAPVASGAAALLPVAAGATNPAGTVLADLLAANFSDAADSVPGGSSAGSFAGGAVVGDAATSSEGVWQYSSDHGASWSAVDTNVSEGAALVLAATDLLRFVPTAEYDGTPGALSVRLIESGGPGPVTGSVLDLTGAGAVGGESHVSAGTVAVTASIGPVPVVGVDRALGLDGTAHVDVAATGALEPTGALTLEAWVQLAANSGIIVDTLSGAGGYRLSVDGTGHLTFLVGNGAVLTTLSDTAPGAVADGGWHHVAATYSGSEAGSALALYIDGAASGEMAGGAHALGQSAGGALQLGNGMVGGLNDVGIWSTTRTQGQIATDMSHSLAGNESGLAGYWRFDESSGITAYGSSAGTPSGTIAGTASHLDVGTTVQASANAAMFKGMILGFDPGDQSLNYTVANNGDTAHGHVAFSGNAYVYTPSSGHITQDDSFTVTVTDATAHATSHAVTVHPV